MHCTTCKRAFHLKRFIWPAQCMKLLIFFSPATLNKSTWEGSKTYFLSVSCFKMLNKHYSQHSISTQIISLSANFHSRVTVWSRAAAASRLAGLPASKHYLNKLTTYLEFVFFVSVWLPVGRERRLQVWQHRTERHGQHWQSRWGHLSDATFHL